MEGDPKHIQDIVDKAKSGKKITKKEFETYMNYIFEKDKSGNLLDQALKFVANEDVKRIAEKHNELSKRL